MYSGYFLFKKSYSRISADFTCVRPHGSKMDGMMNMSDAAYMEWERDSSYFNINRMSSWFWKWFAIPSNSLYKTTIYNQHGAKTQITQHKTGKPNRVSMQWERSLYLLINKISSYQHIVIIWKKQVNFNQ